MSTDLFAGVPVSDYRAALQWYERLFGAPPAFFPNDAEAVWEVAEHRYLYIEHLPERAGHAKVMLFVPDYPATLRALAERGLHPAEVQTYDNGVSKAMFRDADGNEVAFGGSTAES
ncbi:VOC family protein [Actinokineospora guangxiensis]|uniref:VOC family protein n=1 Tax=Actinokineospora guangxiensis TaxID=1490288 RepID=A0ABW0ERE5_9PSEU